jgi:cytochrome c biogenesis protein CcmG/thiol:disulfide interchange protein DsbE
VRFLGIDYRDDRATARGWQDDRFRLPYRSLYDPKGLTASDLGFPYLPDTYVVDASGTVRWEIFGATDRQELSGLIDQLLADPGN